MQNARTALLLALSMTATLSADVTIRYKSEMKSNMPMPVPAAGFGGNLDTSIYMKGNRGVTTTGALRVMVDFVSQQVTVIDPDRKLYATIPASEYFDHISGPMPKGAMAFLDNIKSTVESRATGRTDTIQGVQAQEREIVFNIEMPMPAATHMPALSMKMTMQVWTAAPGETLRNQALRQLTGFGLWQKYFMNPADAISKLAPKMFGPLMEQMQKDQGAMLRMNMGIYMTTPLPGMEGLDPNAPLFEVKGEIVQLSADPVDGALFEIPEGFAAAPFDDVWKPALAKQVKAMTAPAQ